MAVSEVMSESASRLARTRARNHDALVRAARGLFTRQGYEATTIAQIAEAADLGFGTFYRHFADKEAILHALLDLAKVELDEVLMHPENDAAAPRAALEGLTTRFARAVRRNHDLLVLFWTIGVHRGGPGSRYVGTITPEQQLPALLAATVRRIIERGVAAGAFTTEDAVLASRFVASAHMYLLGPTSQDHDEDDLISTLVAFELRALGAGAAEKKQRKGKVSKP
jgi:AcrR family transcriptional regulator